jgi:protease I
MNKNTKLADKKVAILVANGFEQVEMTEPRKALELAGAKTEIVSPEPGKVKGWQHTQWGDEFPVDVTLDAAQAASYDALLLPGGVMNPDRLRANPRAAICHGPWTLIEADLVRGRRLTSYHSIQTDLKNAGANWVDEAVVVDHGLITSRQPSDIPAFNQAMIEEIAITS